MASPEEPSRIPDLDAAAADLRIDLEVESRRRERWIRHRLAEEATLAGALAAAVGHEVPVALPAAGPALDGARMDEVLDALAEERTEVVLTLDGGTSVRGVLVAVGTVATVDTGPGGRTAYVPLSAIVSVTRPG